METPVKPYGNAYTQLTVKDRPRTYKSVKGHSMTVPDQSMSLRTIIERFSRGLPITGTVAEPVYSETELPNIKTLDLTERMEMANTFSQELLAIQDKIDKAKTRKEKDELKSQLKAELAAELEAEKLKQQQQHQLQPPQNTP